MCKFSIYPFPCSLLMLFCLFLVFPILSSSGKTFVLASSGLLYSCLALFALLNNNNKFKMQLYRKIYIHWLLVAHAACDHFNASLNCKEQKRHANESTLSKVYYNDLYMSVSGQSERVHDWVCCIVTRGVYPSRKESIHPKTDWPRVSICPRTDWLGVNPSRGSIHPSTLAAGRHSQSCSISISKSFTTFTTFS